MAAVRFVIHNKTLKTYFNRLKDNGRPGKTGIVALERKPLVVMDNCWMQVPSVSPGNPPLFSLRLPAYLP